jgi:hypothetical protein
MSQKTIQLIIGQLLTDEEFRHHFLRDPVGTLFGLRDRGFELTVDEIDALVRSDRTADAAKRSD